MKHALLRTLIIRFLVLTLSAALSRAALVDLLNSDFESGTGAALGSGTVKNWGTVGSATFTWVDGLAGAETHRGRKALAIGGVAAGSSINNRWVQLSTSYFTVTSGQQFDVSAWLKGSTSWDLAKDGYRFQIEFLDASNAIVGTWASGGSGVNLLTTANWAFYTQTSTAAPSTAVKAKISLVFGRLTGSTSTNPVLTFDDVSAFPVGSVVNKAYPEPMASWTSTDIANQRTAAQSLMATINGAGNGTAGSPVVITIPPGDYRFDTATANTFKLSNRSYVTINGAGARFWFDPFYKDASNRSYYGVEIVSSHDIILDGITIDYTVTPYTQGYVTAINPANGAITFTLEPGFSSPTTIPTAETTTITAGGKILFFDNNGDQINTLLDYPCACCGVVSNADGSYTMNTGGGLTMYGGRTTTQINAEFVSVTTPARVAFAARRWKHAVILDRTVSSQLSNITIYSSPQMGLTEQNGSGASNTYTNCRVVPRPNTDRMLSSNADGFHSLAMSGGPSLQYCEIANTGDDVINIHGLMSYVYDVGASNRVTFLNQIAVDTVAPATLRFYSQPYLKPKYDPAYPGQDFNMLASPTPTAITSSTDPLLISANLSLPSQGLPSVFQGFLGYPVAPVVQATVDKTLSSTGANIGRGDLAMKRSKVASGALVQNSYFHDTFASGIILNGENATISSNTLINIGTCSIRVAPSIRFLEGPYSRNVAISGNTIVRNGWSSLIANDAGNVQIGAITVTGDSLFGTRPSPASAEHTNIAVTGNTIKDSSNCGIFMTDVSTGAITGNTIQNPYYFGLSTGGVGWKKLDFNPAPNLGICVANSDSLTVSSNTVTSASPAPAVTAFGSYGWLTNFTGP